MDEQTLARATEPFFTTKGVGKGTGLGLSMVQGFAEQAGGKLALKSRRGAGTAVELWLPLADVDRESDTSVQSKSTPPFDIGPSLRILIVDDDKLVLSNAVALLEDMGHEVTTAESGEEALTIFGQGVEFDLVITDLAMPRMTGLQLAEAIRGLYPAFPVLLMSGFADLPEGERLSFPRLSKPFTQNELAKAIRNIKKPYGGEIGNVVKFLRTAV